MTNEEIARKIIYYSKRTHKSPIKEILNEEFDLSGAFTWTDTPEGGSFWLNLYRGDLYNAHDLKAFIVKYYINKVYLTKNKQFINLDILING